MKKSELRQIIREEISKTLNENQNFGFWFRAGKQGEKQAEQAKELLKQNDIDFTNVSKFAIEFDGSKHSKDKMMSLMQKNGITKYVVFTDEK